MKLKNLPYLSVIALFLIALTFSSCKKEEKEKHTTTRAKIEKPVLLYKTDRSANFKVNIKSLGGGTVISQGLCVAPYHLPTIDNETFPVNNANLEYFKFVNNLNSDKTYYVRAWVENEVGIGYSEEFVLYTPKPQNSYIGGQIIGGGFIAKSHPLILASENVLSFWADLNENDTYKTINISLPITQPNSGTYLFEGNSEDLDVLSCGFYTQPNGEHDLTFYNITNGTMTITNEVDMDGQYFSMGSFSFTATLDQEVVEITDGAFKIYY